MQNFLKLKTERFCDNMYLHIGKDVIVNNKKIIGIFNIERNNDLLQLYGKTRDKIIDISDGTPKTLILIYDNLIDGYITNISSTTLKKREI